MRLLSWLLMSALFVSACTSNQKEESSSAIGSIGKGQMPAITKDANNSLHVVYGYGDSILYAYSSDAGKTFSQPVLVDTINELVDFATRGPQVAVTKTGLALIAVNKAGNIFSYSKDASGKWTKTAKVNDADTTDKEGFLALAGDGETTLFAIWPDLRNDGHNKVYGARSTDGGKTWSKNIQVYASPEGSICECCRQSVVMNGAHVYVMFRNLVAGNRDIYLVESSDAGQTFGAAQKLGIGSWHLDGCPMDGGGLTAVAGDIQTAWRRKDSIFFATPGKQEEFVTTGKNVAITAAGEGRIIAWLKDNQVWYKLNNGEPHLIGTGRSQAIQQIGGKSFICVWEDQGIIRYSVVNI